MNKVKKQCNPKNIKLNITEKNGSSSNIKNLSWKKTFCFPYVFVFVFVFLSFTNKPLNEINTNK